MALELKTRKWGHSVGLVIPKETLEQLKIKPNDEVLVEIKRKGNPLRELFGAIKFSKPGHQLVKEMRREMEGKWLR